MQCRNYMEQYSRTKSIREINKTRSSYKQLLHNSKTRQNSNNHANLKLSVSKKGSEKLDKNVCSVVDHLMDGCAQGFPHRDVQPLANTQNIHNTTNLSFGKLNSKMKLKVTADKSIRSMSSHQQFKQQNNLVGVSMANMGVGLGSQKKKPKIVTLTANSSQINSTSKKQRNYNQLSNFNENDKSFSVQKSQNNSIINSKYSTSMAHEAAYMSVKREKEKQADNNAQTVTLNTSMILYQEHREEEKDLSRIYDRVKVILEDRRQKQKQWEIQRNYYKSKIKMLEKQLEESNKKYLSTRPNKSLITQPHHNNPTNTHTHNHNHSASVNMLPSEEAQIQKSSNRKLTFNR